MLIASYMCSRLIFWFVMFQQKMAYHLSISYCSSDVCYSVLIHFSQHNAQLCESHLPSKLLQHFGSVLAPFEAHKPICCSVGHVHRHASLLSEPDRKSVM